jgi:hypothetical protein
MEDFCQEAGILRCRVQLPVSSRSCSEHKSVFYPCCLHSLEHTHCAVTADTGGRGDGREGDAKLLEPYLKALRQETHTNIHKHIYNSLYYKICVSINKYYICNKYKEW